MPKGSNLVLEVHSGRLRRRATATRIIRDPARARWTRSRPPLHSASSRQALKGRAGWRTTTTLMRREVAAAASRKSPPPRERSCEQRSQASPPHRDDPPSGSGWRADRAGSRRPPSCKSLSSRARLRRPRPAAGQLPAPPEDGAARKAAAEFPSRRVRRAAGQAPEWVPAVGTELDSTARSSLGRAPHAGRGSRTPRQRGARGPGIGTTDDRQHDERHLGRRVDRRRR